MSKVIGIDLGTTNSAVAVVQGGSPVILENKEGNRTTPSMVAVSKSGERLVGLLAKRQAVTNPGNTLFSVKRLIGRRFDDAEVQRDMKTMPYKIVKAGEGSKVVMGDKEYSPQEISAMVLAKIKADVEERLGEKVTDAVITVPAYFDDAQRKATIEAGTIAGLNVLRIINEPTAAALAYGFNAKKNEKIAVYDLGGGTFDVSILDVSSGEMDTIEVLSTNGDTHLGGDDFDQKVIHYIIDEFKKSEGIDLSKDTMALQRIKEAAEKAKIELSTAAETEINQPFITVGPEGPKHLVMKITRAKLEELVHSLVEASMEPVKKALADAKLKVSDINEVVMVGGMTRMPLVLQTVEKFFGKKPNISVNPDEVVALGAAVQGGVLDGSVNSEVLLLDVTPLTLGIETMGGVRTPIIDRNTTIPVSRSQTFSTAADNQPQVDIHILQGEREIASGNKSLGRFVLDGIPPAMRGVPQIEVAFDIDASGILSVSAKDKATGKEQKIRIESSTGLSKEEVERMKKDAEAHADEDKARKEWVEAKNMADSLAYQTEKALKDAGDKVTEEEKKAVDEKIAAIKALTDTSTVDDVKKATEELSTAMNPISEKLYKAASEAEAAAKAGEPAAKGGESAPKDAETVKDTETEAPKPDEQK